MFTSRIRIASSPILMLVSLALVGLGTHALPAAAAANGVTPGRYVRTVCTTLGTWVYETAPLDHEITTAADRLGQSKISPQKAKAKVVRAYAAAARASDRLVQAMKQVGPPQMPQGEQLAADYTRTLTDLRDVYREAQKSASHLAINRESALHDGLTRLGASVDDKFAAIGLPVEVLEANPTMKQLFDSETACGSIMDAFGYSAEPAAVSPGDCTDLSLDKTPCADPHDTEIYLVTTFPAPAGAPFPGNSALNAFVDQQCGAAFASYVGVPVDESHYTFGWFSPSSDTWDKGDRQVICGVENVTDAKLVGSVKGVGSQPPGVNASA